MLSWTLFPNKKNSSPAMLRLIRSWPRKRRRIARRKHGSGVSELLTKRFYSIQPEPPANIKARGFLRQALRRSADQPGDSLPFTGYGEKSPPRSRKINLLINSLIVKNESSSRGRRSARNSKTQRSGNPKLHRPSTAQKPTVSFSNCLTT